MLKGKINNKIGFTMHLTIDGNIIEGTEHYDNQKKDAIVNIKGSIDDNGTMTLNEYDGNNKTGYFEGVFEKEVSQVLLLTVGGKSLISLRM